MADLCVFPSPGWSLRTSATTSQIWWCAGWWNDACSGIWVTGEKRIVLESGLMLL